MRNGCSIPIHGPLHALRTVALALVSAGLAGCLADAVAPVRDLQVTLESPNGAEGAAVIELVGPGLGPVTAPAETGVLFSHVAGDTTRVVILLNDPGSIEFTVQVTGLTFPGVAVIQVSDDLDNARALEGYRARIATTAGRPQ